MARTWCLKGSCNLEAGGFAAAASCFKRAQQLAEEAADVPLELCVMANRAVCEIRRGDPKAAATRSRRALVKAEADGSPEMILATHCIRWEISWLPFGSSVRQCVHTPVHRSTRTCDRHETTVTRSSECGFEASHRRLLQVA